MNYKNNIVIIIVLLIASIYYLYTKVIVSSKSTSDEIVLSRTTIIDEDGDQHPIRLNEFKRILFISSNDIDDINEHESINGAIAWVIENNESGAIFIDVETYNEVFELCSQGLNLCNINSEHIYANPFLKFERSLEKSYAFSRNHPMGRYYKINLPLNSSN